VSAFKVKNSLKSNGKEGMIMSQKEIPCLASPKYPGILSIRDKKWNGIKDENIKPGMKLKING
jgi:membrane-bound lytic murein transglycosylase D